MPYIFLLSSSFLTLRSVRSKYSFLILDVFPIIFYETVESNSLVGNLFVKLKVQFSKSMTGSKKKDTYTMMHMSEYTVYSPRGPEID